MPPHLHPRSTATSTLFAGTLLASFVVVAIPHLVPCPRPHNRGHLNTEIALDEHGKPIRRMRKSARKTDPEIEAPSLGNNSGVSKSLGDEAVLFKRLQQEAEILRAVEKKDRECPVPKPRGALGRLLGFAEGKEG